MKILLRDHNGVLTDLKPHFELVNTVREADVVVLWQDIMSMELCIARTAKRFKKPLIVIQHGRHGMEDYVPPLSNPLLADKICVWGDLDRDMLLRGGISSQKIEITGTTIFQKLKGRTPHKGVNILFSPQHWDYDVEENTEIMEVLKKICKKNKWNLKAKIIERHDRSKYGKYAVYSQREQPNHLDVCAEVLSWADIVVSISEITFELLAQALDIPVIACDIGKPRMLNYNPKYLNLERYYSKAVKKIKDLTLLEETIKQQLENPNELQDERKDVTMTDGGIYIKNPLQKMISVIKNAKPH